MLANEREELEASRKEYATLAQEISVGLKAGAPRETLPVEPLRESFFRVSRLLGRVAFLQGMLIRLEE